MNKRLSSLFFGALLTCGLSNAADLRVYTVGNSLTDGLGISDNPLPWDKRGLLQHFVASSGHNTIRIGKCNAAGAPLSWLWNEVDHAALSTNAPWNVLTLQPFGRELYDAKYPGSHPYDWGMITNAKKFINQALSNSPSVQPCIYASWPEIPNYLRHEQYMSMTNPAAGTNYTWAEADALRQQALAAFEAAGGWDAHWKTLYTNSYDAGNWDTKSYFEKAVDILNRDRRIPGDPIKNLQHDVLIIPVGNVMYELNQRLKTNPTLLPRAASAGGGYYTNILQMHADVPHLRAGVGRFICAATWYAVLYGQSPAGLDYTIYNDPNPSSNQYYDYADPYYEEITAGFASAVCDAAWDVVSTHPQAGVATADADSDGLPDWWETQYYGGATNANPSALCSNGVNTATEAYVAGLDPNNKTAALRISIVSPQSPERILHWQNAFARIYTVHWSSNLLNGFQTMVTNFTGGTFTDLTHGAEEKGFYKLEVKLAP